MQKAAMTRTALVVTAACQCTIMAAVSAIAAATCCNTPGAAMRPRLFSTNVYVRIRDYSGPTEGPNTYAELIVGHALCRQDEMGGGSNRECSRCLADSDDDMDDRRERREVDGAKSMQRAAAWNI